MEFQSTPPRAGRRNTILQIYNSHKTFFTQNRQLRQSYKNLPQDFTLITQIMLNSHAIFTFRQSLNTKP